MNKSKISNPRNWDGWRAAGALEGMAAARARALAAATRTIRTGWSMDAEEMVAALDADESVPFIGRPSEVAEAIAADARAVHASKYSRDGETFEDQATRIKTALDEAVLPPVTELLGAVVEAVEAVPFMPLAVGVEEAARALGVHPTTVRRRLARGTYQGTRSWNTWSITDPTVIAAVVKAG